MQSLRCVSVVLLMASCAQRLPGDPCTTGDHSCDGTSLWACEADGWRLFSCIDPQTFSGQSKPCSETCTLTQGEEHLCPLIYNGHVACTAHGAEMCEDGSWFSVDAGC